MTDDNKKYIVEIDQMPKHYINCNCLWRSERWDIKVGKYASFFQYQENFIFYLF